MNTPQLAHVPLAEIEVSATNEMFREEADYETTQLQELIDSIREQGVIQPVLLRPGTKKKYQLVCGERRYRASLAVQMLFKDRNSIPSYIRTLTDEQAIELQVTENLQRANINPMKEAHAFAWMVKNLKLSAAEISKRIGKSPDYVEERIRLNKLHTSAQDYVRKGILPLKAALKIARIPEHLHIEALKECTETIDGAKGKTVIFTGLSNLQDWLNYNVFNDLAHAEWDKEDSKLVPSAGSCVSCTQRTKNTGGLFDDIAKNDLCLNGACFRLKQTTVYLRLANELKAKNPGAEVVFKERSWNGKEGLDTKKITPIIGREVGAVISEKAAKADKHAKLAVYIGDGSGHNGVSLTKKFDWITTAKVKAAAASAPKASPQQVAARQKERDDKLKARQLETFEATMLIQEFNKHSKTLPLDLLRMAVVEHIDNTDIDDDSLLPALKELGIDWEMIQRQGNKGKRVHFKAKDADVVALLTDDTHYIDQDCARSFIGKASAQQVYALYAWIVYQWRWSDKSDIVKLFKIDSKTINAKAKQKLATWWKEEQARRKAATPAAAGKVKKGLGALLKK